MKKIELIALVAVSGAIGAIATHVAGRRELKKVQFQNVLDCASRYIEGYTEGYADGLTKTWINDDDDIDYSKPVV